MELDLAVSFIAHYTRLLQELVILCSRRLEVSNSHVISPFRRNTDLLQSFGRFGQSLVPFVSLATQLSPACPAETIWLGADAYQHLQVQLAAEMYWLRQTHAQSCQLRFKSDNHFLVRFSSAPLPISQLLGHKGR